jgi:hypothetical protein
MGLATLLVIFSQPHLVTLIGSRNQSYDFDLQRQRCKFLQRRG